MNENDQIGAFNVTHVFSSLGLERQEIEESLPGDIIALTGASEFVIGSTATDLSDPTGFPTISLTEPTLKINLAPNTSPFAGREGDFCTARQLEQA